MVIFNNGDRRSRPEPQPNKHGHIHYEPAKRGPEPWSPEVYAKRERRREMHIRVALCALGLLVCFALWALGAPHPHP